MKNNKGNTSTTQSSKSLAVTEKNNQIAVNSGYTVNTGTVKKEEKKKSHVGTVIIIALIILIAGAAAFFGYKYYTEKVSKEILADLTGTWIYDTGSAEAGYFEFRGNDEAMINGVVYNVTADKENLTFTENDEKGIEVGYQHNDEQLMLMLEVENELVESCVVTVSPSDVTGVLLYRISDSHSLDDETIQAAYTDKFPQYIEADVLDILGDIIGGDSEYGDLSDYLPYIEDSQALEDFFSTYASDAYEEYMAENDGEFDFSEFVSQYFSDWGTTIGGQLADELDGTEVESFIEDIYGAWQIYEALEEGDYESILDSAEDWGLGDWSDWGDWGW